MLTTVYHSHHKIIKQKFSIDDKKCFLGSKSAYYMISEGSCDTEDWINGWLKLQRRINYILKYKNDLNCNESD